MAYKQNSSLLESSTYSPEIIGSTTDPTVTYTTQNGIYYRFGKIVLVKVNIQINTISGGSGLARITLPFSKDTTTANFIGSLYTYNVDQTGTNRQFVVQTGGVSSVLMTGTNSGGTGNASTSVTTLSSGDFIRFDFVYDIA